MEDLDVRGLKCPLPAMLARKALARLEPGAVLMVLVDDPMALVDMPYMCHREGHTLEATDEQATHITFRIRAKSGPALMPAVEGEAPAVQDDPARPAPCRKPPPQDQDA